MLGQDGLGGGLGNKPGDPTMGGRGAPRDKK